MTPASLTADEICNELEQAIDLLSREDLPALMGKLESLKAMALVRLFAPPASPSIDDRLLDVNEAAARLGVSRDFLYHRHGRFPFTVHIGHSLRFSSRGIDEYIRRRSGRGN